MFDIIKSVREPVLKRIFLSIEEGNWQKADILIEDILNQEPENGYAYLGKLMIDAQVHVFSELMDLANPLDKNINFKRCLRFCDDEVVRELNNVNKYIIERNEIVNASREKGEKEHSKFKEQENDVGNTESMKMIFKRMLQPEGIRQLFTSKGTYTSKEFLASACISLVILFVGVVLMSFISASIMYSYKRQVYSCVVMIPFAWVGLYIATMGCMRRMSTMGIKYNIASSVCIVIIVLSCMTYYNTMVRYYYYYDEIRLLLDFMSSAPASAQIFELVLVGIFLLVWKCVHLNR